MRIAASLALLLGMLLTPTAVFVARHERDRERAALDRRLAADADLHAGALEGYFAQARSSVLMTGNAPAFARLLAEPGGRAAIVRRHGGALRDVTRHLAYLEQLYPTSIGEACLIDADGEEYARVVRGDVARPSELSLEEEKSVFFRPTFALDFGQVHQTKPYESPDTGEWVVANATLIPQRDGRRRAFVHFEVTVESFRRVMGMSYGSAVRVIDGRSGRVIIDGSRPQRIGAPLGAPADRRFARLAATRDSDDGFVELGGRRTAWRRVHTGAENANDWIVVAGAAAPATGFPGSFGPLPIAMLVLGLTAIALAGTSLKAARRELERHATTDALTGLGNRRMLLGDLDRLLCDTAGKPASLVLLDLNGFKNYNDTFGHIAGDAVLTRLGVALAAAVGRLGGRAYRLGGDEFCAIAPAALRETLEHVAATALSESGEGFAISAAFGSVVLGGDVDTPSEALRRADAVMYAQKHSARSSAERQSSDVLLRALAERHPDLGEHQHGVAELAGDVGRLMGVEGESLRQLRLAARLHDVGKVAIPDAIITKAGPLTDEEWGFIRRHTLIGERILTAAPALGPAATLVRASHEAWDGTGYPDRLAGAEIPLGARIIAVCDAYDAMLASRPYALARSPAEARAELRRCAGSQFDPEVVAAFDRALAAQAAVPV